MSEHNCPTSVLYVGTILVNAKPMTRKEYNTFRGWELPSNENGDDLGYLVEYLDGGEANTSSYKGYVSWSPKEVFEKSYLCCGDTSNLPSHMVRVLAEYTELRDKTNKLKTFLTTTVFKNLDEKEKFLLVGQMNAMQEYLDILKLRLDK